MSSPLSDARPTLSATDDSEPPPPEGSRLKCDPLTDIERFTRTLLDAGVLIPRTPGKETEK
jgi:hypothetical protein